MMFIPEDSSDWTLIDEDSEDLILFPAMFGFSDFGEQIFQNSEAGQRTSQTWRSKDGNSFMRIQTSLICSGPFCEAEDNIQHQLPERENEKSLIDSRLRR